MKIVEIGGMKRWSTSDMIPANTMRAMPSKYRTLKITAVSTLLFICCVCCVGQDHNKLVLKTSVRVSGTVVDQDGKPVAEARIEHANSPQQQHKTDANGHFSLQTDAPAVVIRKPGYQSQFLHTKDWIGQYAVLQKIDPQRSFPTCKDVNGYLGFEKGFQFPPTDGIKATPIEKNVDYVFQTYFVMSANERGVIEHGTGAMWGSNEPRDEDVWQSTNYEETFYSVGDFEVIDAKGQFADGKRWRNLGTSFESASYREIDAETARIFDTFLDKACLSSKHLRL